MKRRPIASLHSTPLPLTMAFLAACARNATTATGAPPPRNDPPPPPPQAADSGVAVPEPVRLIRPGEHVPLAGAPMPVTPHPPAPPPPAPAPAPSAMRAPAPAAAPAAAPVPMAAAAGPAPAAPAAVHPLLAGRPPGVYLVHDHPPGTPCHPVSQTEVDALQRMVGQ